MSEKSEKEREAKIAEFTLEACKIVAKRDEKGIIHFESECPTKKQAERMTQTLSELFSGGEVILRPPKIKAEEVK